MHWSSWRAGRTILPVSALFLAVYGMASPLAAQGAPQQATPPAPNPGSRFVVVLDAAHGGDDTGGHLNDGQFEKAATLAFSVRLRSLLTARGIQVVTTREADQSIDPDHRAQIANHANAQACITLHIAETGSGVHIFTSSLTPAAPVRFAPWKTAQAGYMTRSLRLAGVINSALNHANTPVTLSRTALPGIDSMTCPAVALELAPERSADKKTTAEPDDPDYQARVAGVLAAAILEWRTEPRQP